MTVGTFEISGCLKVSVEVPLGAVQVDLTKTRDEVIPIVQPADSSCSWNITVAAEMLRDMGYSRGPAIVDLLFHNGPTAYNRFMEVMITRPIGANASFEYKVVEEPPEIVRSRCLQLAQLVIDKIGSHVLSPAEVYAITARDSN